MARCCLGEVRENQQGAGVPCAANRFLFVLTRLGSWLAILNQGKVQPAPNLEQFMISYIGNMRNSESLVSLLILKLFPFH